MNFNWLYVIVAVLAAIALIIFIVSSVNVGGGR